MAIKLNFASNGGYALADENILLRFLFEDAEVAQKHSASKRIGDAVINTIRTGTLRFHATGWRGECVLL